MPSAHGRGQLNIWPRRVAEAGQTWVELEALTAEHGLAERTMDAMYEAVLGYRSRTPTPAEQDPDPRQAASSVLRSRRCGSHGT